MNKKGSMELSVNSIVILVIAIVMLGLILGFVRSKFSDIDKQLVNNEPAAPTANSAAAVTVSRSQIIANGGEKLALKFQIYNTGDQAVTDMVPHIDCTNAGAGGPTSLSITANGKTIAPGEVGYYEAIVQVGSASKGKYLCKLTTSPVLEPTPYESDIVLEIR